MGLAYDSTASPDAIISPPFFIDEIRAAWERVGKPRIPDQIVQQIAKYWSEKRLIAVDYAKRIEELKVKIFSSP